MRKHDHKWFYRGDAVSCQWFNSLDPFAQGYVEALFWLADEELNDPNPSQLSPSARARIVATCARFIASLSKDSLGRTALDLACDYAPANYTAKRAGVDFWLTRNGHGAGFWDRGLGPVGDELARAANRFGDCSLYVGDDGKLHLWNR